VQWWGVRRARIAVPLTALLLSGCVSSTSGRGQSVVETTRATPNPSSSSTPSPTPTPSSSGPTASPTRSPSRSPTPTPHRTSSSASTATPPPASGTLTVVLNPGHNGGNASHASEINRPVPAGYGDTKACDTTGTSTNAGYSEHAFNWDVALRVRRLLLPRDIRVIMTRPDDTGVGPCVDERAAIGNHPYVAAVVSIHADGAPSAGHGFHVNQDSRRPDGATAAVARRSIELGQAIHAALVRSSGLVPSTYIGQDGYYYRSDLAGLNLARRPATFLELGNMRNAADAQLLSNASGRARIARAVADGILAYLGR
jgi:N-acetylmuramoyl-L-alanine amidase